MDFSKPALVIMVRLNWHQEGSRRAQKTGVCGTGPGKRRRSATKGSDNDSDDCSLGAARREAVPEPFPQPWLSLPGKHTLSILLPPS